MTQRRRLLLTLTAAALATMLPAPATAHGLGGRQDLPVPLEFFVVGAGLVLVVSFVALSVLWPKPRLQNPKEVRTIFRGTGVRAVLWLGGLVGVASLALVIVAGLAGAPNPTRNPAPVMVFVVFWLVVPLLSGLVGNIYPVVDPWRRLATPLGGGDNEQHGVVERVGYLPATVALAGFTWLELVAPDAGPRNLAVAAAVYTIYLMATAALWGGGAMSQSFDGFAAYNRLLGSIGPIRIDCDTLSWRGWLRGLPHLEERPGLALLVVVMIGTVTYDGMSSALWWEETVTFWSRTTLTSFGLSRSFADTLTGSVAMVVVVAVIGGGYWLACRAAIRLGESDRSANSVARRFAHTLVPIAFAYAFAHYFTLVVFEGQYLLSTLSDPLGVGWDLFGTADRPVNYTLIGPNAVWYVQVAVIVTGHLGGVVLAHDRALADFPAPTAVRSQYAMLGLMVLLTGLGLTILAAG